MVVERGHKGVFGRLTRRTKVGTEMISKGCVVGLITKTLYATVTRVTGYGHHGR